MTASVTEKDTASASDRLGLELGRSGPHTARARAVPWHVRLGLSWSSGSPPVVLLLLIGMALGPQALAILSPAVLSAIDPALPVALATLGVQVALELPLRRSALDPRLARAACVEAVFTGVTVTGGALLVLAPDVALPGADVWLIAIAAGICAAMSAGLPSDTAGVTAAAAGVRQLDVVLPAFAGGIMLAWVREQAIGPALLLAAQAVLLALVIGVSAWLLLVRTSSETEQRIFGASALLLLGGLADYLSLSALLSGLVAGTFWRLIGGQAADAIRRDSGHVQHPLLVFLLVVAGARSAVSTPVLGLIAAYPILRTLGKLAGAWLARRVTKPALPDDLGLALVAPGVFGIAFSVNVVRAAGPVSDPLLAAVVIGSIVSQLIPFRRPQEPGP
ncbi:MAG TPA: hypothetical protein VFV95_05255 [Vicinamibacterales bacterium]|nr:hypothetical protein [Vicinamibacterales bacterium]